MDLPATTPVIAEQRSTRLRVGIGGAVVLILVGFAVAVIAVASSPKGVSGSVNRPAPTTSGSAAAAHSAVIYVHVFGAVARPGLYLLADGDRAVDLIAAAGGFTTTADQSAINLARELVDGEQVAIINVGDGPSASAGAATGAGGTATGRKVNLNSADSAALETLPHVGPALAKRIIAWRTKNGHFTSVEDLLSVTGIGEKTVEELKELVSI